MSEEELRVHRERKDQKHRGQGQRHHGSTAYYKDDDYEPQYHHVRRHYRSRKSEERDYEKHHSRHSTRHPHHKSYEYHHAMGGGYEDYPTTVHHDRRYDSSGDERSRYYYDDSDDYMPHELTIEDVRRIEGRPYYHHRYEGESDGLVDQLCDDYHGDYTEHHHEKHAKPYRHHDLERYHRYGLYDFDDPMSDSDYDDLDEYTGKYHDEDPIFHPSHHVKRHYDEE